MWDDPRQMNAVAVCVAVAALAMLALAALAWAVRQPVFAFREVVIYGPLARANPAHLEAVIREPGTFHDEVDARGSLPRPGCADSAGAFGRAASHRQRARCR
jgi:hypothetical protein